MNSLHVVWFPIANSHLWGFICSFSIFRCQFKFATLHDSAHCGAFRHFSWIVFRLIRCLERSRVVLEHSTLSVKSTLQVVESKCSSKGFCIQSSDAAQATPGPINELSTHYWHAWNSLFVRCLDRHLHDYWQLYWTCSWILGGVLELPVSYHSSGVQPPCFTSVLATASAPHRSGGVCSFSLKSTW